MFETLQQLLDFMFMHRLQLSVTNSIAEDDDTLRQHTVHLVILQCSWSTLVSEFVFAQQKSNRRTIAVHQHT